MNFLKGFDESTEKYFNSQFTNDMLTKMINEENEINEKIESNFTNKTINDTNKINRMKSRIQSEQQSNNFISSSSSATPTNSNINLNDFKKVLEELENKIIEYEGTINERLSRALLFSIFNIKNKLAVSSQLNVFQNMIHSPVIQFH